MNESLSCSICTESYDEKNHLPKQLLCFHTFCLSCLKDLLQIKRKGFTLVCPECRTKTFTSQNGLVELGTNFALLEAATTFNELMHGDAKDQVRKKQKLILSNPQSKCEVHPSQELVLLCMDHSIFLCGLCLTNITHRQCNLQGIMDAYRNDKKNIIELTNQIDEKLKRAEAIHEDVKANNQRLQKNLMEIEIVIENYFDQIEQALMSRKTQLLAQAREILKSRMDTLSNTTMTLSTKKLREAKAQMEILMEKECALEILRMKEKLKTVMSLKITSIQQEDGVIFSGERQILDTIRELGSFETCVLDEKQGFSILPKQQMYISPLNSSHLSHYQQQAQGNPLAQSRLGFLHTHGYFGFKKDHKEAFKWYKRASEQGHRDGHAGLGDFYLRGDPPDVKKGLRLIQKAVDQGSARGLSNLGYCLYYGIGVETNFKESVKCYKLAAEQGDGIAQTQLGCFYLQGERIAHDLKKSTYWFQQAVEQGSRLACNCLAVAYAHDCGVQQNHQEALRLHELRAKWSSSLAQYKLGLAYKREDRNTRMEITAID